MYGFCKTIKNPAKTKARPISYPFPVARAISAKIAITLARTIVAPAPVKMAKRTIAKEPTPTPKANGKNESTLIIASATMVTL